MKKILLITIIFLLSSLSVSAIQSVTSPEGNLKIDLMDFSPSPVLAGKDFTATFRIRNIGNVDITGFGIQFLSDFPLETDDSKIMLPTVSSGSEEEFTHDFYVLPTAETATNIHFQYEYSLSEKILSGFFTIPISSLDKNIIFDRVVVEPEKIPPGESAVISFIIENSAPVTLTDIDIRLNLSVPFSPIKTTNERRLTSLGTRERATVTFDVQVSPDADLGAYSQPLEIKFYDPNKNLFTKTSDIGLIVYSKPEYELNLEESDTLQRGTSPKITVSLSDIGTSDIKFLSMELLSTENYKVLSNPRIYLGNLEPDDFETAEYTIYLTNCRFKCNNEIPLKLKLSYKDSFNKQFVDEAQLNVRTYSKSEVRKFGLTPQTQTSYAFIYFIILIILIYMTYKEYRKVKDLPKAIKNAIKNFLIGIIKIIYGILRHIRWRYIKRIPRKIRFFLIKLR